MVAVTQPVVIRFGISADANELALIRITSCREHVSGIVKPEVAGTTSATELSECR